VLKELAPSKVEIPFQHYVDAWKRSVDIFGDCQVSSYVIAGVGESDASIIARRALAGCGIYMNKWRRYCMRKG